MHDDDQLHSDLLDAIVDAIRAKAFDGSRMLMCPYSIINTLMVAAASIAAKDPSLDSEELVINYALEWGAVLAGEIAANQAEQSGAVH
jgi:hypothetical protein